MKLTFPKNFLWGASTSAYQIEGGIYNNDWHKWEKENAERLATNAKNYWQDWQQKKFPEMFDPENYICGLAANSWEMQTDDIECLKKINANAYRFGVEWARIEPEEGKFDREALRKYKNFLKKLKEKDIKVFLTIWHWTMPVWLTEKGGWENPEITEKFEKFSQVLAEEFGDLVDFWVTLNEPLMHIGHGYLNGQFPPAKKASLINTAKIFFRFIKAHKLAYKKIKKIQPKAQIGLTMTTGFAEPANKFNPIEITIAGISNFLRNDVMIKLIKNHSDFIGVNYYHHNRIVWHPPFSKNINEKIDDMGWEIYPRGIYGVLKRYKKFEKPMYILENGTSDALDEWRADYIRGHLAYIHKAIQEGADIRGYMYWSLLDNFEWDKGYWPKFGLFAIDRQNKFKRIMRPSAKYYAEICENNFIKK